MTAYSDKVEKENAAKLANVPEDRMQLLEKFCNSTGTLDYLQKIKSMDKKETVNKGQKQ